MSEPTMNGVRKGCGVMVDRVGRSDSRTPAKHGVLKAMLGKEVSAGRYVAPKLRVPLNQMAWFDLTAGDGATGEFSGDASPLIFARHGLYRYSGSVPISIHLTERSPNTYVALLVNLAIYMPGLTNKPSLMRYVRSQENLWLATDHKTSLSTWNADAQATDFSKYGLGDWLFINNDPNNVHQLILNGEAVAAAVDRGVRLSAMTTMGCNPGGLKRLPPEQREAWFEKVRTMNRIIRPLKTITNLLIEIKNDSAKWAYLLTWPVKWTSGDDRKVIETIYKRQGLSVSIFSFRDEPDEFESCLVRLFLQKNEQKQRSAA